MIYVTETMKYFEVIKPGTKSPQRGTEIFRLPVACAAAESLPGGTRRTGLYWQKNRKGK
jgi:hypothetical protein